MKVIVILLFVLSLGPSAYGQQLHMIEMSTTSSALGVLSFSDDGSSTDKSGFVGANYAYRLAPRVQVGLQGSYARFESTNTSEIYSFKVGAI